MTGALILLITVVAVAGVLRIEINAGFRAYVGAEHPAVRQLDAFIARFGGGLPVAAVWSCDQTSLCETIFDESSLRMAYEVATAMEATAGVRSVQSPATTALLVPTPDGFDARTFVENGEPVADRDQLARRALIDPLWKRSLVSPDGKVGAIVIELASSESQLNISVLDSLQRTLKPFEVIGFDFNLVGDPVEFVVAGANLRTDSLRLVPVVVLLLVGILMALLRSVRASLIALLSVGLAVVWAVGAMGWLGWPQTAVSQALVPFILAVGVCNAIHILSRYATEVSALGEAGAVDLESALLGVVEDVGGACLLASLTTAAGFASFATSGAVSFVHFGLTAAIGVIAGLVVSFSLLPILVVWTGVNAILAPRASALWASGLSLIVGGAQHRAGAVLGVAFALAAASGLGMTRLRADVSASSLFGEESRVVQWMRFVKANFREPETLDVVIQLPLDERIEDPRVLGRFAELELGLQQANEHGEAFSTLTLLSWLNRILHDDSPLFERHADSLNVNAELFFLLSSHAPGVMDRWVSHDRKHMRVSLEARAESYSGSEKQIEAVQAHLDSALPEGWSAELAGPVMIGFQMVDEVQGTQLRSFLTAGSVVFVLVAFFFRSFFWACAAMIPTVLPVLLALGAMGAWGIYLDIGTTMVAAVALGIAIDDTVHLLVQYQRRRSQGSSPGPSMNEAAQHVGRAVVTTSIALSMAFFVLTLSSWASVASFGFLSGIAILGAMLADLIVLPALVIAIGRLQKRSQLARRLWAT